MAIGGLNVLGFLKDKMAWHQARQGILAQNVANADTPGYRARDLKALEFAPSGARPPQAVVLAVTQPGHIGQAAGGSLPGERKASTFEITPEGNSVVLEEEMLRVGQNAMDYQTVSELYGRSLSMLRKAVTRR